jgi:hypothetical protein
LPKRLARGDVAIGGNPAGDDDHRIVGVTQPFVSDPHGALTQVT